MSVPAEDLCDCDWDELEAQHSITGPGDALGYSLGNFNVQNANTAAGTTELNSQYETETTHSKVSGHSCATQCSHGTSLNVGCGSKQYCLNGCVDYIVKTQVTQCGAECAKERARVCEDTIAVTGANGGDNVVPDPEDDDTPLGGLLGSSGGTVTIGSPSLGSCP